MNHQQAPANRPVIILGLGNQAKAWALNLRDSGRKVILALRKNSPSLALAQKLNFPTLTLGEDPLEEASYFAFLTPDHTHKEILETYSPWFPSGSTFIYAHGQSPYRYQFAQTFPAFNHVLLAPKAIASELRFHYETKGKLGAAYCIEQVQNPAKEEAFLLELAKDLGITAGPYKVSFQEETFCDLFSEQAILCSLLPYAALSCFNQLRKKKMPAELAYMECWYELKLIIDTMVPAGPEKFFQLISPAALIGSEKGKAILIDQNFQQKLQSLLEDIFTEKFFKELDQSSVDKVRENVLAFWKKEEFFKIHQEMAPFLY